MKKLNYISSEKKYCHHCGSWKYIDRFGIRKERHNGDGRAGWCKDCQNQYARNRYQRLRKSELVRCKNLNLKYKNDWNNFFIKVYGKNPRCEICNKQLKYYGRSGNQDTVYWDHRHNGNESIKKSPKIWLTNRACNKENIEIWHHSDFGILCSLCNIRIPTENRLSWLNNLINYIRK